ncbi:MAG: hypothetical protein ACPGYT_00370 [Nitrospirales bacterium]
MSISKTSWPSMPESVQQTLSKYLVQVRKRLDAQIETIILYGSLVRGEYVEGHSNINVLLLLRECSISNLQACSGLSERWRKEGIVAPLVLAELELKQSFTLFQVEYCEIKENHVLLEGRDPFLTLHIDDKLLAHQCQRELNGNLLRVRQRFIEGNGRPEAIPALLTLSLMALLPTLRAVCRTLGHPYGGKSADFLKNLPNVLNVDEPVFLEVLEIKQGSRTPGKLTMPDLFMRYVQGVEIICTEVRRIHEQEG